LRKSWKDYPCYLCSDMSWSNDTSSEKIIPIHRNDTVVYCIPLCVEEGTIDTGGHCVVVTYNIFYFTITVFIIQFCYYYFISMGFSHLLSNVFTL